MTRTLTTAAILVGLLLVGSWDAQACTAGCTPGYWKNHIDAWVTYKTTDKLGDVFNIGGTLGDTTLLQALSFPGGPGVEGAQRILFRAAVASLLNSTALGGEFLPTAVIVEWVQGGLDTGDRGIMINIAATLDLYNNTGCPLN